MSTSVYRGISGTVFAVVALAHAWRAALALPITVGQTAVPVWASWAAAAAAALLCLFAFRARD